MIESRWRLAARPIIQKIILDNKGKPENEIRKLISAAYPFNERKYHPYKVWLNEVNRQLGKIWPVGHKQRWMNDKKRIRDSQAKLADWESIYGRREG